MKTAIALATSTAICTLALGAANAAPPTTCEKVARNVQKLLHVGVNAFLRGYPSGTTTSKLGSPPLGFEIQTVVKPARIQATAVALKSAVRVRMVFDPGSRTTSVKIGSGSFSSTKPEPFNGPRVQTILIPCP